MMNSNSIIEKARTRVGIEQFDSESFREGLDILVSDINASAFISENGLRGLEKILIGQLAARLKVSQYLREHPDLLDTPVPRPVFVLGAPRTGTTLLNNLLAADPARRSLLRWEIGDPVPPARPGELVTDPRCLARRAADAARPQAQRQSLKQHFEDADTPSECTILHGQDFKAQFLEALSPVPRYSEWILRTDMTSAYRYQKRVLQILQSTNGGTWNLKMPSHALHIEALLDVFPDARIVVTHRDPYKSMGSLCSLIESVQSGFCKHVDRDLIGRTYSVQFCEHLNRPMAARARRGRFHDIYYSALVDDPMAEIRGLYAWLGDELTPEAEEAMRAWLARNPQHRFGTHSYSLEKYGLSVDQVKPLLEPYLRRFSPESEVAS